MNYIFVCAADENTNTASELKNAGMNGSSRNLTKCQATLGYWNDNLIFGDKSGKAFKDGEDDFVTASFWLQITLETPPRLWYFDLYHNILTNRREDYRTDLFTIRVSIEQEFCLGFLRLGSGVIANGNFGGEAVQNWYHRLRNYDTIELPYSVKDKMGLTIFFSHKLIFWMNDNIFLKGCTANSYRTAAGPSNFNTRIELNAITHPLKKRFILHFQTSVGYVDYYHLNGYLSPLFDNGLMWSALISGGYVGKLKIAVWYTNNQYGLGQPHFGISFTFGWNGSRLSDLGDVLFP